MKKSEDYLNEMKQLWKDEPQKPGHWQLWYLTPVQRLAVLRELLCPLSQPENRP